MKSFNLKYIWNIIYLDILEIMKKFPKSDNRKQSFAENVTDLKIGDTSDVINCFHFPPVRIKKIKRRNIWVRNIEKKWSAFTGHPSLRMVHWHSIHLPGWTFMLSSSSTHSCSGFTFPELSYLKLCGVGFSFYRNLNR